MCGPKTVLVATDNSGDVLGAFRDLEGATTWLRSMEGADDSWSPMKTNSQLRRYVAEVPFELLYLDEVTLQ